MPGRITMSSVSTDAERFERLWGDHHAAVWAYAARRVARDRAADVVHETFLVAWRRLDDVPDHARPWLLAVARHAILHERRGAARRARLDERLGALPAATAPAPAPPLEDRALVRAMRELPLADRELLALLAWDGLTVAEAATVLGCRPVTARVRLHRARTRLAALLAAPTPAPTPSATVHPPAREASP
jgi:RNA polymerase sigma-70 factor (ECF subfamily)